MTTTKSTSRRAPRYCHEVRSAADIRAAQDEQARYEVGECPTCHGAVHPTVLASMGQCVPCKFASQRASVA